MNFIKAILLLSAFCMASSIAMAVPLKFDNFTGTFPYTENGFAVTPTQTPDNGSWGAGLGGLGAYANSIYSPDPFHSNGNHIGTIEITHSGGLFYFNSVNVAVSPDESFYVFITGFLNGSPILHSGGSLFIPSAPANALFDGNPSMAIDSLFITVGWSPVITAGFSVNNIDVTALVPDKASTFVLLGVSISALLVLGCRQRLMIKR